MPQAPPSSCRRRSEPPQRCDDHVCRILAPPRGVLNQSASPHTRDPAHFPLASHSTVAWPACRRPIAEAPNLQGVKTLALGPKWLPPRVPRWLPPRVLRLEWTRSDDLPRQASESWRRVTDARDATISCAAPDRPRQQKEPREAFEQLQDIAREHIHPTRL